MTRLLALLLLPATAFAAPLQLSHSGRMLDAVGDPVDGAQSVTFSLYDAATGGAPVWTETQSVTFSDGYFAVILGAGATALEDDDFTTWPLYLGMKIGAGTELSPRQTVVSTPFAVQARTATNVKGGTVDATSVMVSGDLVVDGDVVVGGATVIDASGNVTANTLDAGSISIDGTTVIDGNGNLTVGTIDADALSIGGTTVIDGSGNFTGTVGAAALDGLGCASDTYPVRRGSGWACEAVVVDTKLTPTEVRAAVSGSAIALASGTTVGGQAVITGWSGLTPPADIANGDLLESLGCATGTYPARLSGGWTCATIVVDTDTLDGLQCAEDDVIRMGVAGWECTTVASLTALSADTVEVAGALYLGTEDDTWCQAGREGALVYDIDARVLQVCTGATGWLPVGVQRIVNVAGSRRWSDGSFATSCAGYRNPPAPLQYAGDIGSGNYTIDPDGTGSGAPYPVYCDMTTADGGWTLAMNLDTSDGHVMWWGYAGWTDTSVYGQVGEALTDDLKTEAFNTLPSTTEILIVVHQEGAIVGWKRWQKSGTGTLRSYLVGGDNTTLGSSVLASSVGGISSTEKLVRATTGVLYANRCVNGACVTNSGGSPDGDRLSSAEANPSNNTGGGLGNWHDMGYCCSGTLGGHTCNGSGIRTASEAQAGWHTSGGMFGDDSYQPPLNTGTDSCSGAGWSAKNGIAYDYAIYLR